MENKMVCKNCGSDKLEKIYITWSSNGTTVQKIKCLKCKESMWRTNLSQEEIDEAKLKPKALDETQYEFIF